MPSKSSAIPHNRNQNDTFDRLVDLKACIEFLESRNQIVRIHSPVSSKYELAGIAKQYEGKKCLVFEKVKGSKFPVFMGMLWNRETVGQLFGKQWEEVPFEISDSIASLRQKKESRPPQLFSEGPANEVVEETIDLYRLPVPIHALKDGGRYLDASVVMAKNPDTGGVNTSIHRMMVTRKDRLTFLIDPGRHLGEYVQAAEKQGSSLQVTINNGPGLAPWLASIIPAQGDGKYQIAEHMIGRSIPLIKAQKVDVPAYADAQFVIEAEILPDTREQEGPFAEVTGYYAARGLRWVMRVLAITRREEAVFHSLLSGKEVWNAVGFTAEAKIFHLVKQKIPSLKAVYLDHGGCGFYGAVIQLDKSEAGIAKKAIQETFKAFEPLQRVIAVDIDVNLYDPNDVNWAITTRFHPDRDLLILPNQVGHILNPMVAINSDGKGGTVTKMGIDATAPYPKSSTFERVDFMKIDFENYEISE